MKNIIKSLLVLGVLTLSGTAVAVPITGAIGFTGDYAITGGSSLGTATGIDIIGDTATVEGAVTGTFALAGISAGDTAYYNDFSFSPFTAVSPLWQIGAFSFSLNTLSVDYQSDTSLVLSGTGIFSGSGYDDSYGDWVFTANALQANFTFSNSNAVPEPGVALLLGIGLAGIGVSRKLRKS